MSTSLQLLCAGGFRAAIERMAPEFEKASGVGLNLSFTTPAKTREWLEAGFPFDLGIVVGAVLDKARQDGFGFSKNTFKLALSPLGMGVPEHGPNLPVSTLADLKASLDELESIALSDPAAGTNVANEVLASAEAAGLTALRAKAVLVGLHRLRRGRQGLGAIRHHPVQRNRPHCGGEISGGAACSPAKRICDASLGRRSTLTGSSGAHHLLARRASTGSDEDRRPRSLLSNPVETTKRK